MEQRDKSVERLSQNVNAYFPECQRGEEEGCVCGVCGYQVSVFPIIAENVTKKIKINPKSRQINIHLSVLETAEDLLFRLGGKDEGGENNNVLRS